MSIVAASLYRNGKRIGPVSLDQPVRCAADRSEFVWIGLFEPSEAELRQLQENYALHPLAIEDALLAHQLPKLDIYGDQLFVVARPAYLAGMAKSPMARPRSSLAKPSSSAFATGRSARTPGSVSS